MAQKSAPASRLAQDRSRPKKSETDALVELDKTLRGFIDKRPFTILLGAVAIGFVYARLR